MSKLIFIFSLVLGMPLGFALEEHTYKITEIKEIDFQGNRLKEDQAKGLSGKGYRLMVGDDMAFVEKEELDILVKFLGFKDVKELVGSNLKTNSSEARSAIPDAILNAKKKGRYVPPSEDEFIDLIAKDLVEAKDHCPTPTEYADSITSLKYGRSLTGSEESQKAFATRLNLRIAKLAKSGSVTSVPCPEDLVVRGPNTCYEVKIDGKTVTTFNIGPYDGAGINCKAPDAGARTQTQTPKTPAAEPQKNLR
jgi:hypothetical protein